MIDAAEWVSLLQKRLVLWIYRTKEKMVPGNVFFRTFAIGMFVPGVLSLSADCMKKTIEFFYSSNVMLNVQFLPDSLAGGSQES